MLLNRRCRALVQLPRLRRNCIAFKSRAFVRNRSLSCVSLNISMNIYLSRGFRLQPLALVCVSPSLSALSFVLPSLATLSVPRRDLVQTSALVRMLKVNLRLLKVHYLRKLRLLDETRMWCTCQYHARGMLSELSWPCVGWLQCLRAG